MARRQKSDKVRSKAPSFFWKRFFSRWPFLVWLMAIIATIYMFNQGIHFGAFSGYAETIHHKVAPVETGRIVKLLVKPGQAVKKGQVLCTLDDDLLSAQIELEKAMLNVDTRILKTESELEDVKNSELKETISSFQQDMLALDRQFSQSVVDAEAEYRHQKLIHEKEKAELEYLKEEVAYLQKLVDQRITSSDQVRVLKIRMISLKKSIELYPETIMIYEKNMKQAKEKYKSFASWSHSDKEGPGMAIQKKTKIRVVRQSLLADLAKSKSLGREEVSARNVDILKLRRRGKVLIAEHDGVVSQVFHQTGNVVQAGEPVMDIVIGGHQRFIGFLPETNSRDVRVGSKVYISDVQGKLGSFKSEVVSLSPEIFRMPGRFGSTNSGGVRGRRVILRPLEETHILPGETISIYMKKPFKLSELFQSEQVASQEDPVANGSDEPKVSIK